MQGVPDIWSVTHCNLGHAYRMMGYVLDVGSADDSNYASAQNAYAHSLSLTPSSSIAMSSLALLAHLQGDVRTAIRMYHSALSLGPQDPMSTVLLEMALKEQMEELEPRTLPGLPEALGRKELDPFRVPKVCHPPESSRWLMTMAQGNPSFGPLPIELDPPTLADAGGESIIHPANSSWDTSDRNELSVGHFGRGRRERSRSRRVDGGRDENDRELAVEGEGSEMDIEED